MFYIRNDPRFTPIGKILARTGLDELPQIINIFKGDMQLVGPRPFPVDEEKKIHKKWRYKRQSVKPGLLSSWIVDSSWVLDSGRGWTFEQWMELDMRDIKNESFFYDFKIILKTILLFFRSIANLFS